MSNQDAWDNYFQDTADSFYSEDNTDNTTTNKIKSLNNTTADKVTSLAGYSPAKLEYLGDDGDGFTVSKDGALSSYRTGGIDSVETKHGNHPYDMYGVTPSLKRNQPEKYKYSKSALSMDAQRQGVADIVNQYEPDAHKTADNVTENDMLDVASMNKVQALSDIVNSNSEWRAPFIRNGRVDLSKNLYGEKGMDIPIMVKGVDKANMSRTLGYLATEDGTDVNKVMHNDKQVNTGGRFEYEDSFGVGSSAGGYNPDKAMKDALLQRAGLFSGKTYTKSSNDLAATLSAIDNIGGDTTSTDGFLVGAAKSAGATVLGGITGTADAILNDLPDWLMSKGENAYYDHKIANASNVEEQYKYKAEKATALEHSHKMNGFVSWVHGDGFNDKQEYFKDGVFDKAAGKFFGVDEEAAQADQEKIKQQVTNGDYGKAALTAITSDSVVGNVVGSIIIYMMGAGEAKAGMMVAKNGGKVEKLYQGALRAVNAGDKVKAAKYTKQIGKRLNLAQKVAAKAIERAGATSMFVNTTNEILGGRNEAQGQQHASVTDVAIAAPMAALETLVGLESAKVVTKPFTHEALKDLVGFISKEASDKLWQSALKTAGRIGSAAGKGAVVEGSEEYLQQWADILGKQWNTGAKGDDVSSILGSKKNQIEAKVAGIQGIAGFHVSTATQVAHEVKDANLHLPKKKEDKNTAVKSHINTVEKEELDTHATEQLASVQLPETFDISKDSSEVLGHIKDYQVLMKVANEAGNADLMSNIQDKYSNVLDFAIENKDALAKAAQGTQSSKGSNTDNAPWTDADTSTVSSMLALVDATGMSKEDATTFINNSSMKDSHKKEIVNALDDNEVKDLYLINHAKSSGSKTADTLAKSHTSRVEDREITSAKEAKGIKSIKQGYVDELKSIGKDVKDRELGDTDYAAGLRHAVDQISKGNTELTNRLVAIENKNGGKVDTADMLQHLINIHNKEEDSSEVGSTIKGLESTTSKVVATAKNTNTKLNTASQKAGLGKLVGMVEKLGLLRATKENTQVADVVKAEAEIAKLENEIKGGVDKSTLFNDGEVAKLLSDKLAKAKNKNTSVSTFGALAAVIGKSLSKNSKEEKAVYNIINYKGNKSKKFDWGSVKDMAIKVAGNKMKGGDSKAKLDLDKLDKAIQNAKKALNKNRAKGRVEVSKLESALRAVNNGWHRNRGNSVDVISRVIDSLGTEEADTAAKLEDINKKEADLSELEDNGVVLSNKEAKKQHKKYEKAGSVPLEEKEMHVASQIKEREKLREKKIRAEKKIEKIKESRKELTEAGEYVKEVINKVLTEHNGEINKNSIEALADTVAADMKEIRNKGFEEADGAKYSELMDLMHMPVEFVIGEPSVTIASLMAAGKEEALTKLVSTKLGRYIDSITKAEKATGSKSPVHVDTKAANSLDEAVAASSIKKESKTEQLLEEKNKLNDAVSKQVEYLNTMEVALVTTKDRKVKKALKQLIADSKKKLTELKEELTGKDSTNKVGEAITTSSVYAVINERVSNGDTSSENTGGVGTVISKHKKGVSLEPKLASHFNASIAIGDIVTFKSTLSTATDLASEAAGPLMAAVDDVHKALKGAFYSKDGSGLGYYLFAQNPIQFGLTTLIDPNGGITESNMKMNDNAALAVYTAAQRVLSEDFASWTGYKEIEQMNKYFGNDSAIPSPAAYGVYTKLRHAYPTKMVYEKAGKKLAQELGFVTNYSAMTEVQLAKMYTQLGHFVVTYMKSKGQLDVTEIKTTQADRAMVRGESTSDVVESGATYNFIQAGEAYRGTTNKDKRSELLNDTDRDSYLSVMTTERAKGTMTYTWSDKVPTTPKNTVLNGNIAAGAKEAISSGQKEEYGINIDVADDLLNGYSSLVISGVGRDGVLEADIDTYEDNEKAREWFGRFDVQLPSDIADSISLFKDRNTAMEKYNNFIQAIEHLKTAREQAQRIADSINTNKATLGIKNDMHAGDIGLYSKYFYSKNGRYFMDISGGMNPQTEKEVARWLLTPKGLRAKLDLARVSSIGKALSEGGSITSKYSSFIEDPKKVEVMDTLAGIAMGFGVGIDKEFTTRSVAVGHAIHNMTVSELKILRNKLRNGEEVEVSYLYRMVDWKTGLLSKPAKDTMTIGKEHEMQREVMIDALIKAKENDEAVTLPYELDGVTNGTYFKTGEAPVIPGFKQMLNKTGVYFEDDTINGVKFKDMVVRPQAQDVIAMARSAGKSWLPESSRLTESERKQYNDAYISILDGFVVTNESNYEDRIANSVFHSHQKKGDEYEIKKANSALAVSIGKFKNMQKFVPSSKDSKGMVTKAFRDLVKYPKMIFDYGGMLYNIRKAFVDDLVYSVADSLLADVDSAIKGLQSGTSIDSVKADHPDALSLLIHNIDGYTKTTLESKLVSVRKGMQKDDWVDKVMYEMPKDKVSRTLTVDGKIVHLEAVRPPKLYDMLYDLLDNTEGYELSKNLIETSGTLIDYNSVLNNSAKWMGHIYKYKLNKAIEDTTAANKRVYTANGMTIDGLGEETFSPSIEQLEYILAQLNSQGFTPVVETPYDDPSATIEMIDDKLVSDSKLTTQMPLADKSKKDGYIQKTVGILLKEPTVVNALASVADTHFSDGVAMGALMEKYGIVGVHDAAVTNGGIASDVTNTYGEVSWNTMIKHNPINNYATKVSSMYSKLSAEEQEELVGLVTKMADKEKPMVKDTYSTFDADGNLVVKPYITVLVETGTKRAAKFVYIEDLLNTAKLFNKLVIKNKNELVGKEAYITQFAGAANGEYTSKTGTIPLAIDTLTNVNIESSSRASIDVDSLPIKELGRTAKDSMLRTTLIDTTRKVLREAVALTDDTVTDEDRAIVDTVKRIMNTHDINSALHNNLKDGLVDYIMLKQKDGKLPEKLTNDDVDSLADHLGAKAANASTYGALMIDLYNLVVAPKLKEDGLLDISNCK